MLPNDTLSAFYPLTLNDLLFLSALSAELLKRKHYNYFKFAGDKAVLFMTIDNNQYYSAREIVFDLDILSNYYTKVDKFINEVIK